jgi:hypothetical protein
MRPRRCHWYNVGPCASCKKFMRGDWSLPIWNPSSFAANSCECPAAAAAGPSMFAASGGDAPNEYPGHLGGGCCVQRWHAWWLCYHWKRSCQRRLWRVWFTSSVFVFIRCILQVSHVLLHCNVRGHLVGHCLCHSEHFHPHAFDDNGGGRGNEDADNHCCHARYGHIVVIVYQVVQVDWYLLIFRHCLECYVERYIVARSVLEGAHVFQQRTENCCVQAWRQCQRVKRPRLQYRVVAV